MPGISTQIRVQPGYSCHASAVIQLVIQSRYRCELVAMSSCERRAIASHCAGSVTCVACCGSERSSCWFSQVSRRTAVDDLTSRPIMLLALIASSATHSYGGFEAIFTGLRLGQAAVQREQPDLQIVPFVDNEHCHVRCILAPSAATVRIRSQEHPF